MDYVIITGTANRARLTVLVPAAALAAGTPAARTPQTEMTMSSPGAGTPTPGTVEAFAAVDVELILVGEETPLSPGEGVAFGPDVVHTFRDTGTEPAALLLVRELPPDRPVLQFVQNR